MDDWPKATDPWLQELMEKRAEAQRTGSACDLVTTGSRAVVAVEALICRKLCYPSRRTDSGLASKYSKIKKKVVHVDTAECLEEVYFNGPREALAALNGMVMTGMRSTAFLLGNRLPETHDLLFLTAGHHLPVVLHAICRVMHRQTSSSGSGHEGYHAVADSGIFLSMARNQQQAVDLTMVTRAAAELALVPGLVAQDGAETAFSARDVVLPNAEMVENFLGFPDTDIASPTPAQRIIFGERRSLLPCLYSLDRPTAQGAAQGAQDFSASLAGQQPFFNDHLQGILQGRIDRFKALTGRGLSLMSEHRLEDAKYVLVVQGSSIGTAEAIANHLRETRKMKVGVLGITWLRPFALETVQRALKKTQVVSVLERMGAGLAQDPPLLREIRAALSFSEQRLVSVVYGSGGELLTAAQLVTICENMMAGTGMRDHINLGLEPISVKSEFPKREILLQEVRKEYPSLEWTSASVGAPVDLRPEGAKTVTLHAHEMDHPDDVLVRLGEALPGRHVRSRSSIPESGCWSGRVSCADRFFANPGDATPVDCVLIARLNMPAYINPVAQAVHGGAVVIATSRSPKRIWQRLPAAWRQTIRERNLRIYRVPVGINALIAAVTSLFKGKESDLELVDWPNMPEVPVQEKIESEVPMIIRLRDQQEASYDNISHFWSQVVQPRLEGESPHKVPDPGLTFGSIPSGSSTFNDRTGDRIRIPVIDASICTGCGACWTACPDSAIGPVAIQTEALLDAAAAAVENPNAQMAPLTRAHRQLAGRIDALLHKQNATTLTAEVLDDACAWLQEKMPVAEADQAEFGEAIAAERRQLERLPMSVTKPFFHDAHREKKGTGSLLGLAVNTQACQGCKLCSAVCPVGAVLRVDQTPARIADMRARWNTWEHLPDTPGDTIARIRLHADMDPLAAILLSRHCLLTVAGGDGAEPGSGERIALRHITAVVEHRMQKINNRRSQRFAELAKSLRSRIRETLADSLSLGDLDALDESLSRVGRRYADVSDIISSLEEQGQSSRVDRTAMQHMTQLARDLEQRHWLLTEGPTGLGRARFGLVVTSDSVGTWAVKFPYNPFSVPFTVDPESDGVVLGILKGYLADLVDQYRLFRRAEMALDPPRDHILQEEALKTMTWRNLPAEDLEACPPVLFVGGSACFGNLKNISRLLTSGLPIRIVLMDGYEDLGDYGDSALFAMALQKNFVLSTSIAHHAHLYEGVNAALTRPEPALIRLYTPSPRRHGFHPEMTMARAQDAVAGRVHPLFTSEPTQDGAHLSLAGNPVPDEAWVHDGQGRVLTPAHWARGERRFTSAFTPVPENDPRQLLPMDEWLQLDSVARSQKIPVLPGPDDAPIALEPMLVHALENREAAWSSLREMAGHSGTHGGTYASAALAEREQAHQDEVVQLKQAYENKLRELEERQHAAQAQLLREQLLRLSGMVGRKDDDPVGAPQ